MSTTTTPTTLHFSGQVDSQGIDYLIGERNVLAELTAAGFGDGRTIFVYHDGSCICRGPAELDCGSANGSRMTARPGFWVGEGDNAYDVIDVLDDADGFPIDLTVTDDANYGQ